MMLLRKDVMTLKRWGIYLLLQGLMLLFSLSTVFAKVAAGYPMRSWGFLFYYGLVIAVLGLYAILWQQVVKHMPLTSAYAGKAVTVVWGMLWGVVLFHESLSPVQWLGGAVIVAGVVLYALADKEDPHD